MLRITWEKKKASYKEAPIQSLSSLAFDGIVGGTPLSGVGPSRRFALGLGVGRAERAGRRISGGGSGGLIGGRERQG